MNQTVMMQVLHLITGLSAAAMATALLITGHIDQSTGVALIIGALGISTTAAAGSGAALGATTAALGAVASTYGPAAPVSVQTSAPAGLGSLGGAAGR